MTKEENTSGQIYKSNWHIAHSLTIHKVKDKIHLRKQGSRHSITLLQEGTEMKGWRTACQLTCIILAQKPDLENLSWDSCAKPKWPIYKAGNKTEGGTCHLTLWQEIDKSQCVSYSRMWCQPSEKSKGLLYYTLAFHVYLDICLFTCIYNDMSTKLHSKMSIEILSEMYRFQWFKISIYSVHPWRFFKVSIWKCYFHFKNKIKCLRAF